MIWEASAKDKFDQMLAKVPVFLRPMAAKKVGQGAERIAQKAGHAAITEKDLVDAFFAETPFGFHGPMKTDMESLGIDYIKYGHEK